MPCIFYRSTTLWNTNHFYDLVIFVEIFHFIQLKAHYFPKLILITGHFIKAWENVISVCFFIYRWKLPVRERQHKTLCLQENRFSFQLIQGRTEVRKQSWELLRNCSSSWGNVYLHSTFKLILLRINSQRRNWSRYH